MAPQLVTSDNDNNDDKNDDSYKKNSNIKRNQSNRIKTKMMRPVQEENSNSISDNLVGEECPILTTATATATSTTTAITSATDSLMPVDSKYYETAAESVDAAANAFLSCQCDLYLEQAVCKDDVADEEEAIEILSDLHSLCQVFGIISDVWVQQGKEKKRFYSSLMMDNLTTTGESELIEGPWIFMEFDSLMCASRAVGALDGLHIGGEILEALHYNYDAYQCEMYDSRYCVRAVEDNDEGIQSKSKSDTTVDVLDVMHDNMMCECDEGAGAGAVVLVRNYVSAEDIEDCAGHGHGEELAVMKKDLLLLCTAQSQSQSCPSDGLMERSIRRITILSYNDLNHGHDHGHDHGHGQIVVDGEATDVNTSTSISNTDSINNNNNIEDDCNDYNNIINDNNNNNNNNDNDNDNDNNDDNYSNDKSNSNSNITFELTACVRFKSIAAATDAMLTLDGTLLSGNTLKAAIRIVTSKSLLLTGPSIVLHVNYPDINGTQTTSSTTSVTPPSTSTSTSTTMIACNSFSVARDVSFVESIKLNSGLSDSVAVDHGSGIPTTTSVCEINDNVKVQDPRVSVYTEAVLAPKLKKNTVTDGMIKVMRRTYYPVYCNSMRYHWILWECMIFIYVLYLVLLQTIIYLLTY